MANHIDDTLPPGARLGPLVHFICPLACCLLQLDHKNLLLAPAFKAPILEEGLLLTAPTSPNQGTYSSIDVRGGTAAWAIVPQPYISDRPTKRLEAFLHSCCSPTLLFNCAIYDDSHQCLNMECGGGIPGSHPGKITCTCR